MKRELIAECGPSTFPNRLIRQGWTKGSYERAQARSILRSACASPEQIAWANGILGRAADRVAAAE